MKKSIQEALRKQPKTTKERPPRSQRVKSAPAPKSQATEASKPAAGKGKKE